MGQAPTLDEVYRAALKRLKSAGMASPGLEARLLVEQATGTTETDRIVRNDMPVTAAQVAALDEALARRLAGEPVHRILGYRDFYGLRLALSPGTLEPRPDTESLVDAVLPFVRRVNESGRPARILDLGTGTGAIALALLSKAYPATALGVDLSADALATAEENAESAGVAFRFEARRSNWFGSVDGTFHAIVSNPPYIRSETIRTLPREVRDHDPVLALDGGEDGLDAYRVIATQSANHLEPDGIVAVEIGYDQKDAVSGLFTQAAFTVAGHVKDLAAHDRVLIFHRD